MIEIIQYKNAHLDLIQIKERDRETYDEIKARDMENNSVSFTGIHDGRVLIVGGIVPITEYCGYCWTLLSRHVDSLVMETSRAVKKKLEEMMDGMGFHRVQTASLQDAFDQHRWCKMLGFIEEGPLHKNDEKKRDYIRFAKLRED